MFRQAQHDIESFQDLIWGYYRSHGRTMPWRSPELRISEGGTLDPYSIVVSEAMLQQTQVSRVQVKFPLFMALFPSFTSLAQAPTAEVIRAWQGLGYNRRALSLQRMALSVEREYNGRLPHESTELMKLSGIGPQTAGSIAAFAFNYPSVFIETNIRRVFIHHFFSGEEGDIAVFDKQLLPLIEVALDRENPREWYWALMDYGAMLAKTVPNPNRRSRHYTVQSKFEGSDRQIRGRILKILSVGPSNLQQITDMHREKIIAQLTSEGFIARAGETYSLI